MLVSLEYNGSQVVLCGLLEALETLSGDPQGQNYFYNNNKILFALFTVFVQVMQNLWLGKTFGALA